MTGEGDDLHMYLYNLTSTKNQLLLSKLDATCQARLLGP